MKINKLEKNQESVGQKLWEIAKNQKIRIATVLLVGSLFANDLYADDDKKANDKKTNEVVKNEINTGETIKNEINTIESTKKINENLIYELFINRTLPDLSGKGKELQIKREGNYFGTNEERNLKFNGDFHRKRLIEGFSRMIKQGHLDMIVQKLKENNIPIELLFLAIAESYWEADVVSPAQAKGFWQFIEETGKTFGAIDQEGNDFRSDPEISTDAAIKLLKNNYDIVNQRVKETGIETTKENKRMFAMYIYNGGPKLVKKAFIESKGDANLYPFFQKSNENRNYVARVLAIRNVLYELGKRYNFNIDEMEHYRLVECCYRKPLSEIMIEEYFLSKNNLDNEIKCEKINKIKKQLDSDYEKGLISGDIYLEELGKIDGELTTIQILNK